MKVTGDGEHRKWRGWSPGWVIPTGSWMLPPKRCRSMPEDKYGKRQGLGALESGR